MPDDSRHGWTSLADLAPRFDFESGRPQKPKPGTMRKQLEDLIAARPRRVILNPGTESEPLERALDEHGIPYLEACTLVLLATGQFENALPPAPLHAPAVGGGS